MPRKTTSTTGTRKATGTTTRPRTSGVRNTPIPRVPAAREITQEQIAQRAYEIYCSGSGGTELDNWLQAERELRGA